MTERKRALTDLRPTAEQTLFADWRVTPELKAKLRQRIEASAPAAPGPRQRQRPWVRWGGAGALAAAAVVALVMIGQSPDLVKKFDEAPAKATAPAPVQPPAQPAPKGTEMTVTGAPAEPLRVQVMDQSAPLAIKTVTTSATFTVTAADAYGNAVSTATPPVPGIESQPGRKIVLNAEYQLQVTDAVTAMQRLQNLAATTAGYVVDAALNKGEDGSWAGRLTLRLPAGQYNGAIQEVRRIGEVKQERQWSQDVTDRYYDLEARVRIQQEYERKLQELAEKATTFDDWMKLTRQINDTRALIEQMQGSLKLLDNQVDYSTINLTFFQPAPGKEPPKPPEPAKGLGPAMARAFGSSLGWFGDLGQALLIGAAAMAPFLVAALVLGLIGLVSWRRWRTSRRV